MKFFQDKVLITGGCGYIGSHTAALLLQRGYEVVILDSNINSNPKVLDRIMHVGKCFNRDKNIKISFHKGDLRDYKFLKKVFEKENMSNKRIGFVIHFAGLKSVNQSVIEPLKYWDFNVNGSINLLKIMLENDCKNIIFSSSATVYDTQNESILNESTITNPKNPYGKTKLTIENILKDIYNSADKEFKIACLRYFNPVGAHSTGLIGEDPLGKPNNIFPIINNVAARKQKKVEIFGNDWNTPDGTCIRDYVHVEDVALGHLNTLEYLNNGPPQFLILNIGTGKGTSVLDLIKIFEKVNNLKIPYVYSDRRIGDVDMVIADNSLLYSNLGWKPEKSLEEMCIDGWKWKFLNPNGYS